MTQNPPHKLKRQTNMRQLLIISNVSLNLINML